MEPLLFGSLGLLAGGLIAGTARNFFNDDLGMTRKELKKMVIRSRFSRFLPYRAYDPETKTYYNADDSLGFLWECAPLVYADDQIFSSLAGLLNSDFPPGSCLQFILYADPFIKPILDRYRQLKTVENNLIQHSLDNTISFFEQGAVQGSKKLKGIPFRNFRLFAALKLKKDKKKERPFSYYTDIKDSVYEALHGIHLSPVAVEPDALINTMAKIFNDAPPEYIPYAPHIEIHKQIIFADTAIRSKWDKVQIGKKHLRWGFE